MDAKIVAWLLAIGWIVNLINGTIPDHFERARGVLGFLKKAIDEILDRMSVVARADAPGSLKLPLARSARPDEAYKSGKIKLPPAVPPAAVLLAALLLSGIVTPACCALHGTCKQGSVAFCATKEAQQQLPHLLPVLADLFLHGVGDLDHELAQLALTLGSDGADIIACAVQSFAATSGAQLYSAAEPAFHETPETLARGHERALAWLKASGRLK